MSARKRVLMHMSGLSTDDEVCSSSSCDQAVDELQPEACAAESADVQKIFQHLSNAEAVLRTMQNNHTYAEVKEWDLRLTSIINSAHCFRNAFDYLTAGSDNEMFTAFVDKTAAYMSASSQEKVKMVPLLAGAIDEFAERLHERLCELSAKCALRSASQAPTPVCVQESYFSAMFDALLQDIDQLRALGRKQLHAVGANTKQRQELDKQRQCLFQSFLVLSPTAVRAAPADSTTPSSCCICSSEFSNDGGCAERLTLGCCQYKQSICKQCFISASFQNSNAGVKSFAHCPFCRSEYKLYTQESPAAAAAVPTGGAAGAVQPEKCPLVAQVKKRRVFGPSSARRRIEF